MFAVAPESEGHWESAILEVSYALLETKLTDGNFVFVDIWLSASMGLYYLEPGLHFSFTGLVEAMNMLFQERHNHIKNFVTVKVFRGT